jgi:hypothetical protein
MSSSILNSAVLRNSVEFQSSAGFIDSEIASESLSLLFSDRVGFASSAALSNSEMAQRSLKFLLSDDQIESVPLLLSVIFSSGVLCSSTVFTKLTEFRTSSMLMESENAAESFSIWISDSVDESLPLLLSITFSSLNFIDSIQFPTSSIFTESENLAKSFPIWISDSVDESLPLLLSITFSSLNFIDSTQFPSSSIFTESENAAASFSIWISSPVDESLPILVSSFFSSASLCSSESFPSLSVEFCDSAVRQSQSQFQPVSAVFVESIELLMTVSIESLGMICDISMTSRAVEQNVSSSFIYSTGFWIVIVVVILVIFGVIGAIFVIYHRKAMQQAKDAATATAEIDDTASFLNSLKRENSVMIDMDCWNPLSDSGNEAPFTIEDDMMEDPEEASDDVN